MSLHVDEKIPLLDAICGSYQVMSNIALIHLLNSIELERLRTREDIETIIARYNLRNLTVERAKKTSRSYLFSFELPATYLSKAFVRSAR